jgi:hypothetical protein
MKITTAALLVAGCLAATPLAAQTQTMPTPAAPSELDEDAPPRPIEGVAATYRTPVRDAQGYVTPNRQLSPEETTWHLRVAFNVAALGCRDADEHATVAAYNALLAAARAPLAAASTGMERTYQVRYGAKWRSAHDDAMTRLYNFFAQTTAHDEFCVAAKAALAAAQTAKPEELPALAAAALPRLEAPFLAFYARFDAYQEEYAAWRGRHLPRVLIASAAPAVAVLGGTAVSAAPTPDQPTPVALAAK